MNGASIRAPPQREERTMLLDLKLRIATHLLSSLINQDRGRSLPERDQDLDHSIELAAELIRRCEGRSPPTDEHILRPQPPIKTREQIVDRAEIPLAEQVAERRREASTDRGRRPTLH